jgi:plastocyanin domain-containing protein
MNAAQWVVTVVGAALIALVNVWFFGGRRR